MKQILWSVLGNSEVFEWARSVIEHDDCFHFGRYFVMAKYLYRYWYRIQSHVDKSKLGLEKLETFIPQILTAACSFSRHFVEFKPGNLPWVMAC